MTLIRRLVERFKDRAYRRSYVDSFADSYLATQIKVLREQRGLTQEQLATEVGVRQSQISRWENANNSSWQIRTLKRLGAALDLVLVVKFESFGKVLPDIESFGRSALERPSFVDDPVFNEIDQESETLEPSIGPAFARQVSVGTVLTGSEANFRLEYREYAQAA